LFCPKWFGQTKTLEKDMSYVYEWPLNLCITIGELLIEANLVFGNGAKMLQNTNSFLCVVAMSYWDNGSSKCFCRSRHANMFLFPSALVKKRIVL
jgi:hypothetical protein